MLVHQMRVLMISDGLMMSKCFLHVMMAPFKSLTGTIKWSKEDSQDISTYYIYMCNNNKTTNLHLSGRRRGNAAGGRLRAQPEEK